MSVNENLRGYPVTSGLVILLRKPRAALHSVQFTLIYIPYSHILVSTGCFSLEHIDLCVEVSSYFIDVFICICQNISPM